MCSPETLNSGMKVELSWVELSSGWRMREAKGSIEDFILFFTLHLHLHLHVLVHACAFLVLRFSHSQFSTNSILSCRWFVQFSLLFFSYLPFIWSFKFYLSYFSIQCSVFFCSVLFCWTYTFVPCYLPQAHPKPPFIFYSISPIHMQSNGFEGITLNWAEAKLLLCFGFGFAPLRNEQTYTNIHILIVTQTQTQS